MESPLAYLPAPTLAGVIAVAVVLLFADILAVALRVKARSIRKAQLKADDFLIFVSLIEVAALSCILIYGAVRGTFGTHTAINPETNTIIVTSQEIEAAELAYIFQVIAIVTLGTLKMSVMLLYRRIFVGQIFKRASMIVCICIALWTIAFLFATIFQCGVHVSYYWQSSKTVALCGDYKKIQLAHALSDIFTDLMVLAIPMPIIWRLHMSTGNKLGLTFMFLLGLFSTAAGTARLAIFWKYNYNTVIGARDLRGMQTDIVVWNYIEVAVGVLDGTLPTLKAIIDRRAPKSLINSARSKLSLSSLKLTKRKGSATDENGMLIEKGTELPTRSIHGDISPAVTNHIEGQTDIAMPELPRNAILRQKHITVDEEPATGPQHAEL